MYPETLSTGHRVIWSLPEQLRTTNLVLVLHDAGSTPETVAEHYFNLLPPGATGLAVQAGFPATFGHNWFTTTDPAQLNFPEIMSAAHRVFDAIDDDEYGNHPYTSIQAIGVGQGAALATTMLRVRPETLNGVIGVNGYVLEDPMLGALDNPETNTGLRVLWVKLGARELPNAKFSAQWLTTHTRLLEAETTTSITPFLTQNVN